MYPYELDYAKGDEESKFHHARQRRSDSRGAVDSIAFYGAFDFGRTDRDIEHCGDGRPPRVPADLSRSSP